MSLRRGPGDRPGRRPGRAGARLAAAAAALLCAGAAGEEAGDRARDLVHEMIAAYGGMERWNALRDAVFQVRDLDYSHVGKPVVVETSYYFRKDPRPTMRIDSEHNGNLHTKVFDGLEAWIALDGALLHRSPGTYARLRDAAKNLTLWLSFPFSLVEPGTRVDYLGETRFMGVDTYVLQVSYGPDRAIHGDDIYRFYLNPVTHLLLREEYFLHGEAENLIETIYGDYRNVQGLVKDHLREIVSSANGKTLQRIEIEGLRFGVGLPDELFRKPPDPLAVAAPVE